MVIPVMVVVLLMVFQAGELSEDSGVVKFKSGMVVKVSHCHPYGRS